MVINNKSFGVIYNVPVMIAKVLQNMGRTGKVIGVFDEKISSYIESMGYQVRR